MKKMIMILLSVILVTVAGCGNKKTDVATNTQSTETISEIPSETEEIKETEAVTDSSIEETETENKEDMNAQSVNETSESDASKQTENSKTPTSNNDDTATQSGDNGNNQPVEPQQSEPDQTEPTTQLEQQPETQIISYSPQNVVSLATAKTKAAGKVLLTENLDSLLASGQISQEEYNEYYPYDGAGYYSVFVDTNLTEARDVSGTENLNSEDKIAQYISDMLVLENGPYFLIEYAGTYDYYGKQCYEFRCYRA